MSSADIKRAYRNLSLRLHPDASRDPETAIRFNMVSKAYATLSLKVKDIPAPVSRAVREPRQDDLFSLGSSLVCDTDPVRRLAAATRLGLSGKRSAWVFLRKGLYDTEPRVVAACIRAASVLGLAQGSGEIANAYQRADPVLRDTILELAKASKDVLFKATLQTAAYDPDIGRRKSAHALLGEINR
ncbi:hypothetical protein MASR2M48_25940 [Spirochaetota bacterium]